MRSINKNKKKRYIYEPIWKKTGYFFCFLSEKIKKREYLFYQKCYEKYYGKVCNNSYKKFSRMMFRKSIAWWLTSIFIPIFIILFLVSIPFGGITFPSTGKYMSKRTLAYEEAKPIFDELEKQWAEEDKLEALQKRN